MESIEDARWSLFVKAAGLGTLEGLFRQRYWFHLV
jgi:hypothetical protein